MVLLTLEPVNKPVKFKFLIKTFFLVDLAQL
jgi:hypothetical protein